LLKRGRLPPGIHFQVFGDDEMMAYLEFLDEGLLPESKQLRLKND